MYVKVHVVPDAKREKVEKKADDAYVMSVREPAKQNLANERVKELLARELGCAPGKLRLVAGFRSPHKIFSVN